MIHPSARFITLFAIAAAAAHPGFAQVNENCTVSILNRNVTAQPDGTWVIPNIPANQGRVRARATCVQNGITTFGQSALFLVPSNGAVNVQAIQFGNVSPIPVSLNLSIPASTPLKAGQTEQISAQALYPDGSSANVSKASAGTDYTVNDPTVATVSPDGLITGVSNGTALITAYNEGTPAFLVINVGGPPTVTITSPISGATATQGSLLPVVLNVTGSSIAAVSLLANQQIVSTIVTPPYQFSYQVPVGVASVTLTATATDSAGEVANSAPITVFTSVDPLTTVTGSVVDQSNAAIAGATVTCLGFSGVTGANGSFSIPKVPTAQGSITCTATFTTPAGIVLSGTSAAVTPVRGGTTNDGKIVLGSLSSRGTDFWMAFQDFPKGSGAQLVVVSETTAHFSISAPGFSASGTATPASPQTVALPNSLQVTKNQTLETKAIHLTSDAEISATFRYGQDGTHDAYLGIPSSALGKEYFASSYAGGTAEFVVAAAENNTNVTITPSCASVSGTKAGTPFQVTLNQGQTYQYQCDTDVTGSHIVSTQPVSVIAGNGCTFIPAGSSSCDIASEMMFPVSSLYGTDFYAVAFLDAAVRIVAAHDNTAITVDDGATVTTYSLNSGQFKQLTASSFSILAYHITSNNPVTVLQFGGQLNVSQTQIIGGPSSLQVVPTAEFRTQYRFVGSDLTANFAIIIVPNASISSVQVNGAPLSAEVFIPVPGGKYQWTYADVFQSTVITANAPFAVYSIGLGVPPSGSFGVPVAF
jgi:hypothetical protein